MPGSRGDFYLEIDATGSEVDIDYQVNVLEEKNIPRNMRFYGEIINEKGGVIKKTKEYASFRELSLNELMRKDTSRNRKSKSKY